MTASAVLLKSEDVTFEDTETLVDRIGAVARRELTPIALEIDGETIYPDQAPEGCSEKERRQWILEELERRLRSMEADSRAGG